MLDPFTMIGISLGISFLNNLFNRPEQPQYVPPGEYKGPSEESVQSVADLRRYMRGGGLGADGGGGGGGLLGMLPNAMQTAAKMFGNRSGASTGAGGGAGTTGNIQALIQKMFGRLQYP